VVVNGDVRIAYDTGDSAGINGRVLEWCDHYFKRSYSSKAVSEAGGGAKLSPLGLNYAAYVRDDWRFSRMFRTALAEGRTRPKRALSAIVRLSQLLSAATRVSAGRAACGVDAFEAPPVTRSKARVFRLTRTWDPRALADAPQQADEWAAMNRMRVECIRALRRELGGRFVGGLAPTPDALRDYRDCVVSDPRLTRKPCFLSMMKRCDIGVASAGLAGSNTWSLAEYVAASRAIVSEPLRYEVPGPFDPGRNYLSFTDPDTCVEQVVRLLEDDEQRADMMHANFAYYHAHVRPDMLVWNTLEHAMGDRSHDDELTSHP
jgi:hypothetical protein